MRSNGGGPISADFGVFRDGHEKGDDPRTQREAFTHHGRDDVWGIATYLGS